METDSEGGDPKGPRIARPGDRIGHYQILAELGRGGMGVVFRARDLQLEREVALKQPCPELVADSDSMRRFLREARAASAVSHPNVVQVFEAFEAEGSPWISLQFVPGRDLESLLAERHRLPLETILRYGEELASALKAAHDRNILHRDIKPRNVLISSDDRALLSDFGLACSLRRAESDPSATTKSSTTTSEGVVLGTPRYMSPEQALGRPLDKRSDIFSLGTVIYETCTGIPPFSASHRGSLCDAIVHSEPEPIAKLNYEVPEELERIIRKAMAKRPDERYQDGGELAVDLRALRRRQELIDYTQTHPLGGAGEAKRRVSRRLLWLLPVLAAAVTIWLLAPQRREESLPRGESIQVTSAAAREEYPALSPDGGRIAYVSDQEGNDDIYLVDVHGGTPMRITDDPAEDTEPAWFPDGSALAFTSGRSGELSIWKTGQLGGGASLLVAKAWEPAVSPDGSRLAFAMGGPKLYWRIGVVSLADPQAIRVLTDDRGGVQDHKHPAWSPDGRTICYATRHGLWTVPSSGGPARPLTLESELDCDPTWAPSGRHVYFTSYRQGTIALWRIGLRHGRPERVTMGTSCECQPSLSNGGARLAYAARIVTRNLVIRELATGREITLRNLPDAYQAAFSPDTKLLCFVSPGVGREFALWLQPLEDGFPSGPPRQLTDHPGDSSHPAFSPDGRWIAYQRIIKEQRDIWIIPVRGGQPVQLTDDPAADVNPVWSPDGSMIAFASERGGGGSHIWITPVGQGAPAGPAHRLSDEPAQACAPAWSPDGSRIAFVRNGEENSEVWIASAGGSGGARALPLATIITRVRWEASRGDLLVCGTWGGRRFTLRRVSPETGATVPVDPPLDLGAESALPTFDVSADGRMVVFPSEETKGDIWLLEARGGRY